MRDFSFVRRTARPWILRQWDHPVLLYTCQCCILASPYLLFYAIGEVTEKHTQKATIESKGKQITKNGEPDNPAFKVERKGKNPVIKKVWCRCYLSWHSKSAHCFVQILPLVADISLLCSADFPVLLLSRVAECQLQHERCPKEYHWHHALHIPGSPARCP